MTVELVGQDSYDTVLYTFCDVSKNTTLYGSLPTTSAKSWSSLRACWQSSWLFLLMLALVKTWFGNAADARKENKSQLRLPWLCGLSIVLCIHTVIAVANSPGQQNGHIAEMSISLRDLTLSYLYIKYSKTKYSNMNNEIMVGKHRHLTEVLL